MTKTAASSSAIRGDVGRLEVVAATTEIAIAAVHGQRSLRHSSQGASLPQYCDSSAPPSTATLTANTKIGKARARVLMRS